MSTTNEVLNSCNFYFQEPYRKGSFCVRLSSFNKQLTMVEKIKRIEVCSPVVFCKYRNLYISQKFVTLLPFTEISLCVVTDLSICPCLQTLLDGNVSFEGKVNLSQPDNNFHILEHYGANQAEPSEHPYTIYFGRWVSKHVMPSIDFKYISSLALAVIVGSIM